MRGMEALQPLTLSLHVHLNSTLLALIQFNYRHDKHMD